MKTENGHWYSTTGEPRHMVEMKTKPGQFRPTTLSDARKEGWWPSVTQILRVLDKPALNQWKVMQAVHAVVTAPDLPGEDIDAKLERVLNVECQQDAESEKARDLGTDIHAAIEGAIEGLGIPDEFSKHVTPVLDHIYSRGLVVDSEFIVVGSGYAGKVDLLIKTQEGLELYDLKTTKSKKLPSMSYPDHRLQTAAYAMAYKDASVVATGNIYISTLNPGEFTDCRQTDWVETFEKGFQPVFQSWKWLNNYPIA